MANQLMPQKFFLKFFHTSVVVVRASALRIVKKKKMPYLAAAIVAPDIKPSDNKKKHDAVHVHTRINQSQK